MINHEFNKRIIGNLTCFVIANILSLTLMNVDWISNKLDGTISNHETKAEILKKITSYFALWITFFVMFYIALIFVIYISISFYLQIYNPQNIDGFSSGIKIIKDLFWKCDSKTTLLSYWILLFVAIGLSSTYTVYLSTKSQKILQKIDLISETSISSDEIHSKHPTLILTYYWTLIIFGMLILLLIFFQISSNSYLFVIIVFLYLIINYCIIQQKLSNNNLILTIFILLICFLSGGYAFLPASALI